MLVPRFPLKNLDAQEWRKKVNMTAMYTIPSETEAIPVLKEFEEVLDRLATKQIEETLNPANIPFFFTEVLQPICHKIIRSRYFKKLQIYDMVYNIITSCTLTFVRNLSIGLPYEPFLQIFCTIFDPEEYFFRCNNQTQKLTSWQYYNSLEYYSIDERKLLQISDLVDILKISQTSGKATWFHARIVEIKENNLCLKFIYDQIEGQEQFVLPLDSDRISQYNSMASNQSWRSKLIKGQYIDVYYNANNSWLTAQIEQILPKHKIKIKHLEIPEENIIYLDIYSPNVQPRGSIVPENMEKYEADGQFINDNQFMRIDNKDIFATPKKKCQSDFLIKLANKFGQSQGFQKIMNFLKKQMNIQLLISFLKGVGQMSDYLTSNVRRIILKDMTALVSDYISLDPKQASKHLSKDKLDKLFKSLSKISKRIKSKQKILCQQYIMLIKMIDSRIKSGVITEQIEGLEEINTIIKSDNKDQSSLQLLKTWAKQQKVFRTIFLEGETSKLILNGKILFCFLMQNYLIDKDELVQFYRVPKNKKIQALKHQLFNQCIEQQYLIVLVREIITKKQHNQDDIILLSNLAGKKQCTIGGQAIKFLKDLILTPEIKQQTLQVIYKQLSNLLTESNSQYDEMRVIDQLLLEVNQKSFKVFTRFLKLVCQILKTVKMEKNKSSPSLSQILKKSLILPLMQKKIIAAQTQQDNNIIIKNLFLVFCVIYEIHPSPQLFSSIIITLYKNLKTNQYIETMVLKCLSQIFNSRKLTQFDDIGALAYINQQICSQLDFTAITKMQFETIREMFIGLNIESGFIERIQNQIYRFDCMENLRGIQYIMKILFESQQFCQESLQFIKLVYRNYSSTQHDHNFFDNLQALFYKNLEQKQFIKIDKILKLIDQIICSQEKNVQPSVVPFNSLKDTQFLKLQIKNQLSFGIQTFKNIQLQIKIMATIKDLKKAIGLKIKTQFQKIALRRNQELLLDIDNQKTLYELKFQSSDNIKIERVGTRQVLKCMNHQNLLVGGKLNPKAKLFLSKAFGKYQIDGKMDRQHCRKFIQVCLGVFSPFDNKVDRLFADCDKDKKGYILQVQFLTFYQKASKEKPATVLSNIANLGGKNYYEYTEQEQQIKEDKHFTRERLSNSLKWSEVLINLLNEQTCSEISHRILGRLGISQSYFNKIQHIKNQDQISELLCGSKRKQLYSLEMLEYIWRTGIQCGTWKDQFIELKGIQKLYKVIQLTIKNESINDVQINIIKLSFIIVKQAWIFEPDHEKSKMFSRILNKNEVFSQKVTQLSNFLTKPTIKINKNLKVNSIKQLFELLINWLELISHSDHHKTFISLIDQCLQIVSLSLLSCEQIIFSQKLFQLTLNMKDKVLEERLLIVSICHCLNKKKLMDHYCQKILKFISLNPGSQTLYLATKLILEKNGIPQQSYANVSCIRKTIFQHILSSTVDEETIVAGTNLLKEYLIEGFSFEDINRIFDSLIFNSNIFLSEQSYPILFALINEISAGNPQFREQIINKVKQLFLQKLPELRDATELRKKSVKVGLRNLGNIGYLNSVLQVLLSNKKICKLITKIDTQNISIPSPSIKIIQQLQKMLAYFTFSNCLDYNPYEFFNCLQHFTGKLDVTEQHDSHEIIYNLLDILGESSPQISQLFEGQFMQTSECQNCQKLTTIHQKFKSISLDIQKEENLLSSFTKYFSEQEVEGYNCQFCQSISKVKLKKYIHRHPQIFMFHLKRCSFSYDTMMQIKLHQKFTFPICFTQRKQADTDIKEPSQFNYNLKGIINHEGCQKQGHYVSFTRMPNNKWIKFNDSEVTNKLQTNIKDECYGNNNSQNKVKKTSKSATILLYEQSLRSNNKINEEAQQQSQQQSKLVFWKELLNMISKENETFSLNRTLASENFACFFVKLIEDFGVFDSNLLRICYQLTFKVWKSLPIFPKMLTLISKMHQQLQNQLEILLEYNDSTFKYFFKNKCSETRMLMWNFFAEILPNSQNSSQNLSIIKKILSGISEQIKSLEENKDSHNQYFTFWLVVGRGSKQIVEFMLENNFISNTMKYFIDHSSYSNLNKKRSSFEDRPKFQSLLNCVSLLLNYRLDHRNKYEQKQIEKQVQLVTSYFRLIFKQNNSEINKKLVVLICQRNLSNSKQIALFILDLLSEKSFNVLRNSMEFICAYLEIEDQWQQIRIAWVLGTKSQTIIPPQTDFVDCFVEQDQRVNLYQSSLSGRQSLIEQTYSYRYSMPEYVLLCISQLLETCSRSTKIKHYIISVSSLSLEFSSLFYLWKQFIAEYENLPIHRSKCPPNSLVSKVQSQIKTIDDLSKEPFINIPISWNKQKQTTTYLCQTSQNVQTEIFQYQLQYQEIRSEAISEIMNKYCPPISLKNLLQLTKSESQKKQEKIMVCRIQNKKNSTIKLIAETKTEVEKMAVSREEFQIGKKKSKFLVLPNFDKKTIKTVYISEKN